MESSSSRMVLRSSRRLLGCCVLLLAAVMLVGFMATSGTPIAGISSQSALKFGFRLVLLLFCHFRHISFSFYGPIVSQYHKMRVFFITDDLNVRGTVGVCSSYSLFV